VLDRPKAVLGCRLAPTSRGPVVRPAGAGPVVGSGKRLSGARVLSQTPALPPEGVLAQYVSLHAVCM
jgi:hypothetical protein